MVNAKTSLTGPILLAVLSLLVGVKGLIHARAAWLQHTVVWELLGRGAPRTWMDPIGSRKAPLRSMAGNEGISPRTGRPLGAVCSFRQQYKKVAAPKRNGHSCVGKLF